MNLTVNLIGTGNVGKTLGHLLVAHGLATIRGVFNRKQASSLDAIQYMGGGEAYPDLLALPSADITFITTPDDAIAEVAHNLCHNPNIQAGSIVLHCSGALSSDVLLPLKQRGCHIASVHPMRSFALLKKELEHYSGTYCALEGDPLATAALASLFHAMHFITYSIHKEKKAIYHIAGVFASNYLLTLSQQALSCLKEAGVEKDLGLRVLLDLMKGTMAHLEKTECAKESLTGPIQRGDIATVEKHMTALEGSAQKVLYAELGQATLSLTSHDDTILGAFERVFDRS